MYGFCAVPVVYLSPVDCTSPIKPRTSFRRIIFLIVAFDLEGTLVDAELFPALGLRNGRKPALDDITDKAMRGDLDFRASLDTRLNLVRGMSIETVRTVAESLSLSHGAMETVSTVKRLGGVPIIITGGFNILADRIAHQLGIEYVCCNRFKVEDGYITGVMEPVVTGEAKAEKLLAIASWLGVKPSCCVAVGDGANDIQMMKATGLSIAYNGREKVCEAANVSIRGKDLRLTLPYIEEFTTRADPEHRTILLNQIG
jgi:phosphoserine phosphatase